MTGNDPNNNQREVLTRHAFRDDNRRRAAADPTRDVGAGRRGSILCVDVGIVL